VRRVLIGRDPAKTLIRALVLAVLCYMIFRFAFVPVYVRGASMEPTFSDGALNLANTLVYRTRDPARGEVVVIEMAGRRTMYLKRILGVPGDTVHFDEGTLIVNGTPVEESYVARTGTWTTQPERLETDQYFVAGDNRATPWEWHTIGIVDRSRIAGRIIF